MKNPVDEFDAVRKVVDAINQFDEAIRDRIIRSALEWLRTPGRPPPERSAGVPLRSSETQVALPTTPQPSESRAGKTDIKSFIEQKGPKSDIQFAATVAFYYQFEAPEKQRKEEIGKDDLLEACRQAGWKRPPQAAQTLRNAVNLGLLDKGSDRGTYRINNVGENLVAMALPGEGGARSDRRRKTKGQRSTKNSKGTLKKAKKKSRPRK